MFSQKIHDLATKIPEGGFRWVEDGPVIRQIIQEVDAFIVPRLKKIGLGRDLMRAARQEAAYKVLDLLDTLYGWDPPRMDDTQERAFYRQIVQWEIAE